MAEELFDADREFWFAGYQSEDGTYHDLQKISKAVDTSGQSIEVDWDRLERFNDRNLDKYADAFERADIVNIAWITTDRNGNKTVQWASLPGGVDLDVFDFDTWVEDYG